jgi:hypothetical protein
MVCPQVADGGDGLQIWRVAANIPYKQSRTDDKGWSSSLGVGLTTPHHKNKLLRKIHKKPRTWTDFLDKQPSERKWIRVLVLGFEVFEVYVEGRCAQSSGRRNIEI